MDENKIEPNVNTYKVLITMYCGMGHWNNAYKFFREMIDEKCLRPSLPVYDMVLQQLRKGGQLKKHEELVEKMMQKKVARDEKHRLFMGYNAAATHLSARGKGLKFHCFDSMKTSFEKLSFIEDEVKEPDQDKFYDLLFQLSEEDVVKGRGAWMRVAPRRIMGEDDSKWLKDIMLTTNGGAQQTLFMKDEKSVSFQNHINAKSIVTISM
ncbi:hypothetical protein OIU84_005095 [Salix udensis]|uniref:Pentatricopeptide repeat-containing protein n=1 Tax=Salix udensis TaxID=889485 RepID=A0AAD6P0J2_9ROSI|nr:hypothetical protein OIU84_005095 [Salix udensis]